jgi:diguanylate cyclase (GGDEF)-like protein
MAPISRATRFWFAVGATVIVAVVAWAVSAARLPLWAIATELALFAVGGAYTLAALIKLTYIASSNRLVLALTTSANIMLATAILSVAAPWLPDALPLSFAVLLSTVLSAILSRRASWSRPLLATASGIVGLCIVWLRLLPQVSLRSFLVWGGLLAGFGMLIEVHRRLGQAEVDLRVRNLGVVATAAHRLGTAADVEAVTRTVLASYQAGFPHLGWGGVLLAAPEGLVPLPLTLNPAGIAAHDRGDRPLEPIQPGDGLAGSAFASGEVRTWTSGRDFRRARASTSGDLRSYVEANVGSIRSALAVPLCSSDRGVIGVIALCSTTREHEWTEPDLMLARGLADQATVALERSQLSEEQQRQARTDHLTLLPNRREFERVLAERHPQQLFSIMVADVDNLKMINDEYGHEAGDRVLRLVAEVLRQGLRAGDTVARVGGDEFAAFLPASDVRTTSEIAERLVEAMHGVASPFGAVRLSIGVAAGDASAPAKSVWERADGALYAAKVGGRNRAHAASETPRSVANGVRWGELVPSVLDNHAVDCVYQPIVRLADRAVLGYEALARISGRQAEGVEDLFAAALRLGRGRELDWLCRRAALAGSGHLDEGTLVFVNVGVPALVDPLHDVDQMLLLLRWARVQPEQVVLELSEREAVTDRARLRTVLGDYRGCGFRFALDDVGEGHSTIEVLAAARPEFIKIARALTCGSHASGDGYAAAITALVTFASATGAQVVAEGVEDDIQLELMRSLGVSHGQGYALGHPKAPPFAMLKAS